MPATTPRRRHAPHSVSVRKMSYCKCRHPSGGAEPMSQHDPRVDAYIAKAAEFARPILQRLRATVHAACPEAEEAIKWGMPNFLYRGKILCNMAAFKQHVAFGFWQSAALDVGDAASDEAMGQLGRISKLSDL